MCLASTSHRNQKKLFKLIPEVKLRSAKKSYRTNTLCWALQEFQGARAADLLEVDGLWRHQNVDPGCPRGLLRWQSSCLHWSGGAHFYLLLLQQNYKTTKSKLGLRLHRLFLLFAPMKEGGRPPLTFVMTYQTSNVFLSDCLALILSHTFIAMVHETANSELDLDFQGLFWKKRYKYVFSRPCSHSHCCQRHNNRSHQWQHCTWVHCRRFRRPG